MYSGAGTGNLSTDFAHDSWQEPAETGDGPAQLEGARRNTGDGLPERESAHRNCGNSPRNSREPAENRAEPAESRPEPAKAPRACKNRARASRKSPDRLCSKQREPAGACRSDSPRETTWILTPRTAAEYD